MKATATARRRILNYVHSKSIYYIFNESIQANIFQADNEVKFLMKSIKFIK